MTVETTQGMVTVTIDGFEIKVPKNTLVIRAAEMLGIQIPRFCDHPLLDKIGACRQCLVEVEGQRKPMASCTIDCTEGMVVRTQLTSAVAEKAQRGVMEFLLINHPLDCPMCDKGGECPLQNQAMSSGQGETRFIESKRTFDKPVPISSQVLLDRERCISCTRCVRASEEIAGDAFIDFIDRGPSQMIGTAEGKPFNSYFSGNTVQVCPVGALTGAAYRFRARPFDLVSVPSVCEHCASGCRQRTDVRRGRVMRRLAGDDPAVNEEWNCDKGRWAFTYATQRDRLTTPLVRDENGMLVPASWPHALAVAAAGLAAARGAPYPAPQPPGAPGDQQTGPRGAGVLAGGRLTLEDAYAYAKFARMALDTNDIDMRARPHSAEEEQFLAACVAGSGIGVSYADLEQAPVVVLAGFEPEDESPIVFLRLRKAVRRHGQQVFSIAALPSPGLVKLSGQLLTARPGEEAMALTALAAGTAGRAAGPWAEAGQALGLPGAVILAGERLAEVPGALAAAARLAVASGARLAWIPRRAGERGAIEAGALPGLLPIGRPVTDAAARAEVARAWGKSSLPAVRGRDTAAMLAAAAAGELGALVVAGVDPADLPDPQAALHAIEMTPFVVSLELRASTVTDRADVVFPVAAVAEKAGTFVNWEGRGGSFTAALRVPEVRTDLYVLSAIADQMDVHLGLPDAAAARAELAALGTWRGERPEPPAPVSLDVIRDEAEQTPQGSTVRLATWRQLLDSGRMQDGEPALAGTARAVVARMSAATAAEAGVADGDKVTVATDRGAVTVPAEVMPMADHVVWLPAAGLAQAEEAAELPPYPASQEPSHFAGSTIRAQLGAGHGDTVTLRRPE
ncbi:MAG TPA: NADH-quinone oxidoreductase subunit G [Streptosporangiaceae bacterium]|nr:NADH-quinone oxidoreductase subunit G [Streptosporangiaceae bacterium]